MSDIAGASFEHFARGEPIAVDVGEIERELASLWQAASHAGGGQSGAVARAALWNLVIPARGREALARTKALVDAHRASGAGPGHHALSRRRRRRRSSATIESNVVSQPGGGRVVYSEEICLVGPAGAEATSARWCARCRSRASGPPHSGWTRRCPPPSSPGSSCR